MNYPITILSKEKPTSLPTKIDEHVKSGEKEHVLISELKNNFDCDKILFEYEVNFGRYKKPQPDIVYWDKASDILIDIEVDEPYNKEEKPIHYLDLYKDNERNWTFQDNGWSVVRFSEYQVVKHTKACIAFLKDVINSIRNKLDFKAIETKYPDNFIHKHWNLKETEILIKNDIRNKYGFKIGTIINEGTFIRRRIINNFGIFSNEILKESGIFPKDYDRMICLINNISDILIDEETYREYIFIELRFFELPNVKDRERHNGIRPYRVSRSEDIQLFNSLITIKENGKRFVYKDSDKGLYNLFLLANEKEYDEQCYKLKLQPPYPIKSDKVLYVREYFTIGLV